MIVVGGYGYHTLHALSLDEWVWTRLNVSDRPEDPMMLALMGCTLLGTTLICFGGHVVLERQVLTSNALYAVDMASTFVAGDLEAQLVWQEVEPKGAAPSGRICCEMADAGLGNVIVFGGTESGNVALNDTHLLQLGDPDDVLHCSAEWCAVTLDQASSTPARRNAMTMTGFGARQIVFGGGIYAEQYFSDV
eukprot:3215597-Prymnesium_polylepis.1